MGTWGSRLYENDEAVDFAVDVALGDGIEAVDRALYAILEVRNAYLEAPEGQRGLVAADIVAALQDRAGPEPPAELFQFTSSSGWKPNEAELQIARQVGRRILTPPSELAELWQASDHWEEWRASVQDLLSRLGP